MLICSDGGKSSWYKSSKGEKLSFCRKFVLNSNYYRHMQKYRRGQEWNGTIQLQFIRDKKWMRNLNFLLTIQNRLKMCRIIRRQACLSLQSSWWRTEKFWVKVKDLRNRKSLSRRNKSVRKCDHLSISMQSIMFSTIMLLTILSRICDSLSLLLSRRNRTQMSKNSPRSNHCINNWRVWE